MQLIQYIILTLPNAASCIVSHFIFKVQKVNSVFHFHPQTLSSFKIVVSTETCIQCTDCFIFARAQHMLSLQRTPVKKFKVHIIIIEKSKQNQRRSQMCYMLNNITQDHTGVFIYAEGRSALVLYCFSFFSLFQYQKVKRMSLRFFLPV